jgi:hypothetical protein
MADEKEVDENENCYYVKSSKGDEEYKINLEAETCTCPYFKYHRHCKHINAIKMATGNEQPITEMEENWLRDNPEFNYDDGVAVLGEKRLAELVYVGKLFINKPGIYSVIKQPN